MKCLFCETEATYSSPHNLCDSHWQMWWDYQLTTEQLVTLEFNDGDFHNKEDVISIEEIKEFLDNLDKEEDNG